MKDGTRVKLSPIGLTAIGLTSRGFDANTRGTIIGIQSGVGLRVLVDGMEFPETWRTDLWEPA